MKMSFSVLTVVVVASMPVAAQQSSETYWGEGRGDSQPDACDRAMQDAKMSNYPFINTAAIMGDILDQGCNCSQHDEGGTTKWACSARIVVRK